ncbi:hypothetical protein AMTR_s00163p00039200 [Amborella trichopoda]|uniref:RNase H type-1 domain-containing protein n=1 Tax=Amborella trichopoda TaxID=13333 RepID=W1PGB9_AMBTC|nr:hypothetical protein AMTR_s00163p00039200 [Amborella trichopoda]
MLNFDVSSFGDLGRGAIGVLQHQNGVILKKYCGLAGMETANEAEMKSLLQGIIVVEEFGARWITEGDLMNVIKWCKDM